MKKSAIVDIISCLFIILFLYTGVYKLLDLHHFFWALNKSPLLGGFYKPVGYALPPIEVIIALLLLIPFFSNKPMLRTWGLYGSAVLMLIFTVYITYMVEFRTDRPCTCGGIISQMNWHQHMYFNTTFTCLSFLGIWLNKHLIQKRENDMAIS